MKIFRFCALASAMLCAVQAQGQKNVAAKLTEATVFFRGAELVHTASATLSKGENTLTIEGLSPRIDAASLKIKATGGAVISAHEFSIDHLAAEKTLSPSLKKWKDTNEIYRAALEKVNIDLKVNADMNSLLQAGTTKNVSGSEKGPGIDELIKTMDYLKSKSEELQAARVALERRKKDTETSMRRLQAQVDQESTKGAKTAGALRLTVTAPSTGTSTFTVTYYTQAAGWTPYYDINVASTEGPVVIAARSRVQQTTGLDWERVKLALSTATPSSGKVAPLFSAWFLKPQNAYLAAKMPETLALNYVSYDKKEVAESLQGLVPGVSVRGVGTTTQSKDPIYVVDGREVSSLEDIDPMAIKSMDVLKDASAKALYGSRAADGVVIVTLKGMDDYVTQSDNAINVTYNIDLPYTIPGNGKAQNIDLQTRETPAEYKYYCAPKLDAETYLLAEIDGWEKLGLLSGKANVTYDGTYVGETQIDASSTQAKLALTLGTDRRVAVKREKLQDFSSRKVIGSDVLQVFTYRITVKNNQTRPIRMVLKDQYPISTQKSVEAVLRKETTPWTANKEDIGVVTWEEEFAAGETKSYQISYSVKYPRETVLNL